MAFKSYSWSIGTTSFRVSQLNYKIERQLQLLKQFWGENPDVSWKNNNIIQSKYYYFMKDNQFLIGEANRPDKDAREKTSGLVDIGVLHYCSGGGWNCFLNGIEYPLFGFGLLIIVGIIILWKIIYYCYKLIRNHFIG